MGDRARQKERGFQVNRQRCVPVGLTHVESHVEQRDPGVVDQNIDDGKLFDGLRHGLFDVGLTGDIAYQAQMPTRQPGRRRHHIGAAVQ